MEDFGIALDLTPCRSSLCVWHPGLNKECLLKLGENRLAGNQRFRGKDLLIQDGTRTARDVGGEQNIRIENKPHESAERASSSFPKPLDSPYGASRSFVSRKL